MATRDADSETVPAVYARIHRAAKELGVIVATHDDDTPEKVDAQWHIGAKVAEFPITVESAQRARERGMTIIVGAPNIVRGGSSSGNQDARELFKLGLADVICADYHAPSLLPAAFRLVDEGLLDLPAAIATVTRNAARAICLADAGEIAPGMRADIAIVRRDAGRTPAVERVYKDGSEVFRLSSARRPAGVSA
jgi:alpha-D-ribose 1-methylphosphonate 5-triphosphate diphosphatase